MNIFHFFSGLLKHFNRIERLLLVLFILKLNGIAAQNAKPDLIYKKDQSIIKAIIVEVNDETVSYSYFEKKKAKLLQVSILEIIKIVYANGEVETYKTSTVQKDLKKDQLDMIHLKNRRKIEGQIISVDDNAVHYKKTGQKRKLKIELKEIARIVYGNGEIERFDTTPNNSIPPLLNADNGIGVYVGAGVNSASQTLPEGLQTLLKPIVVYRGTLGAWWQMNRHLALRLEANYTQQGMKIGFEGDYEQLTMNYLKVPVLLQGQISFGKMAAYANIGGFGGYWLNAKITSVQNQTKMIKSYVFNQLADNGLRDNRTEYGVCGGLGISFRMGKKSKLFAESRYDYGLSDISKYDPKPDQWQPVSNRVLSGVIGYVFRF